MSHRMSHRNTALLLGLWSAIALHTPNARGELPPQLPTHITEETRHAIDQGLEYLARTALTH